MQRVLMHPRTKSLSMYLPDLNTWAETRPWINLMVLYRDGSVVHLHLHYSVLFSLASFDDWPSPHTTHRVSWLSTEKCYTAFGPHDPPFWSEYCLKVHLWKVVSMSLFESMHLHHSYWCLRTSEICWISVRFFLHCCVGCRNRGR